MQELTQTENPTMSAENVGTHFVDDLVNMALTAKRVPELEAKIRELETADNLNSHTIAELNKQIIDHVNAHAETKTKLANAEVDRDNAELRFLEADDAKGSAIRALQDIVGSAQALIAAVTPPEPVPVKPDYTDKWLTDVQGWQSITLQQWNECGGATLRFTVLKPVEAIPGNSTPISGGPSATEGVSVSTNPTAPSQVGYSSTQMSVSTNHAEHNIGVVGTSVEGQEVPQPNPTVETLLGSSSLTALSTSAQDTASASPTSHSEPAEVAPTGPFATSETGTDNPSQSTNVPTGGAETQDSANSPSAVQPKPTEDGEFEESRNNDYWPIPSRASHFS